jgi:hypothetical protein
MCTVTFIPQDPQKKTFVFTSNRDEASNRPTLPPKIYMEKEIKLLYPKDEIAGGTWFAVSEHKKLICLMNGARKAHQRKASYAKSRGVVLKDLLLATNFSAEVKNYNFKNVEPFTIIYLEWKQDFLLKQLIWDGHKAELLPLEIKPHIWSASMTYSEVMKNERHQWFYDFLNENGNPSEEKIWNFHHRAGKDDLDNGFVINRGILKTTSITQVVNSAVFLEMKFDDLQKDQLYKASF